jgi:tetratricopeptide (TPR) repeat protein
VPPKNDLERIYTAAIDALNHGQWARAQDLAAQLLRGAPHAGGAYFIAGVAASRLGQMDLALAHLHRATQLSPQRADYLGELARVLHASWRINEAMAAADRAFALAPTDAVTLTTLGVLYGRSNEHRRAADVFGRAVAIMPEVGEFRFNLGTSLTAIGELERAEQSFLDCLRIEPTNWRAYLTLAELLKKDKGSDHIEMFQRQLALSESDDDAALCLNLALAREMETLGRYEPSFAHLSEGKRRGGARRGYTTDRDAALFDELMRPVTEPQPGQGNASSAPIFIIGMPRSGTTLVERILSSHPTVHSAGELQNFGIALKRISGSTTPLLLDFDVLARVRAPNWTALGDEYISNTRSVAGDRAHFVDKLPHNFLYAGFIARALPNARIICLRRDPMDTCLSNFRQLFAQTTPYYDYSFDILDTGRYYLLFDKLMAHYERTMPGRILQVGYEDLVENQEAVTRRLLAHCNLPWDDACLRFEQNEAPVATASAVQVRSPMFRTSMRRWKRYESQLDGLRKLLEAGGVSVD